MTGLARLVMCLKVRDEEDILADNLRYHAAQGVDAFIVTDNDSRDRTPEILEGYESAGLARVIRESGTHLLTEGHEWVTRMARLAATEHGRGLGDLRRRRRVLVAVGGNAARDPRRGPRPLRRADRPPNRVRRAA